MNRMKNTLKQSLMGLMLLAVASALAAPVGSQFTYQGSLTDKGSPANGMYDFSFELLADAAAVNPLQTLDFDDIEVTQGLFSVALDFGAGPFTGEDYFVKVLVRSAGSADPYTALVPAQRINAVPYATQAEFLDTTGASTGQVLKFNGLEWAPGTDNSGSPVWQQHTNGISYKGGGVLIGGSAGTQPNTDTSLFIETSAGNSPIRARINGGTKFQVQANGGANIGGGPLSPSNGVYVQGEAILNGGLSVMNTSLLSGQLGVSVSSGSDPIIATVNGQFALQVTDNLGVNIGAANANVIPPPSSGLYVQGETELNQKTTITDDLMVSGDASHSNPANAYGFAKAAVSFSCGNAGSLVQNYFNNINDQPISVSNGASSGRCVVNLPFSYQGLYFVTNAEANSGPVLIHAGCSQSTTGGVNEVVVCHVRDLSNNSNIVVAEKVTLVMF